MKLSIQRLRWVLVAGALLLLVVLAAYIGYGRYRKLRAYQSILAKYGITVTHDTFGYTYSQSDKGKKIFTLHAARATRLGDGKYALHDADLTLFGRDEGRIDTVHSSEIEYDEREGIARALGEVHMDLEVPQALGGGATAGKRESAQVIHVKTSGLVYVKKLGVAATDKEVEFRYGDMKGTSKGAEFNSGQSTLNLLADVQVDGTLRGKPVHLTASKADVDRTEDIAHLSQLLITSEGRSAKADAAVLHLRKDGSIEHAQALGNVTMNSGTQQLSAAKLDANLSAKSIPERAKLSGGVVLMDADKIRPVHGSANEVETVFDGRGAAKTVTASGNAKVMMVDHETSAQGLTRSMEGVMIVGQFVPVEGRTVSRLSEIHMVGSALARGESVAVSKAPAKVKAPEEVKSTQVAADDLRVLFAKGSEGRVRPEHLFGTGHTALQQDAAMGAQQTSSGDSLEATLAQASGKDAVVLVSATQNGHVSIRNRAASKAGSNEPGAVSTATADRGTFDGNSERLSLAGNARVDSERASIAAPAVTLDQRTQDVDASGGVQTTLENAGGSVTHVISASALLNHAAQVATFRGTDSDPAKMWQDASQVQAATLLFDGVHKTFSARMNWPDAMVHAVFAGKPSAKPAAKPGLPVRATSVVMVTSPKMDYNDMQREAVFSGGTALDGTMGQVRGQRTVVLLSPAAKPVAGAAAVPLRPSPFGGASGGTIDRVVVSGGVTMMQPNRRGSGDQLLYTAANDSYVLTGAAGKPSKIEDAKQGSVTGMTLLFTNASDPDGSTIVVAGETGGKKTRVHTETEVRQK